MSMIDMLKKRSAENVNKQIEESKTSEGNTRFAEEIQMKNLYDTKAKGKDIGFIRIRLLPNKFNESGEFTKDIVPVREFFHKNTTLEEFKDKKAGTKWYISTSRATLNNFKEFKGQENNDVMQEFLNSVYEKHQKEGFGRDDKSEYSEFYSAFKAKNQYIANVYIEECDFNPELVGQVKAFKFGGAVFKTIKESLEPKKRGKTTLPAVDIFDMLTDSGASLMITVHNEKGLPQFVEYIAEFDAGEPLMIDGEICTEEQAMDLFNKTHDIFKEYVTDKVKTYDEQAAYFKKQYGFTHDKYTHGSAFQAALKEEAVKDIPEDLTEPESEVQSLKTDEVKEESLMDKFKRMQKENKS